MKKILVFLLFIVIIVTIAVVQYSSYKLEYNQILSENSEFEEYKDKEVYGLDIATIINKAVDKNIKNKIEKDENGMFIQNNSNSIEIEIYMTDNETTYKMETFYNGGMNNFIQYYGNIQFKCSKIEYHKDTGRIKHIFFEQVQTS